MSHDLDGNAKADILIVDDTPDNIRLLSGMLLENGYLVRKAINGKMALTAIKTLSPDLILLDINMPDINGYEVCKQIKKDAQICSIPIIFLSALDSVSDKVKAFQVGGVDYITKPFQFEEVLARIQTQLTLRNLQTQLQTQNEKLQQTLDELKKAQMKIIQQEKMVGLGQLAAGLTHEINNPISFIAGNLKPARDYIQSLVDLLELYQREYPHPTPALQAAIAAIDLDFLIPDLQKLVGSMQTGVERIRTIMLAFRIFSRLDESDIKTVDLHQGLDSTLLLLQHRLKSERLPFTIQVSKHYGSLPLTTCYASQLNQVFFHLLNNAVDALELAIERGAQVTEPTIWITTAMVDAQTVQVRIRDNGIGIAEAARSHLFEPFYTTKPVGGGKGLGLAISHEIVVEKHGGQLVCQSTPGEGAEFIVEIPVKRLVSQLNED